MSHIFSWRRCVWPIGDRVVHANTSTIEVNAIQLGDALRGFLNGAHSYEAKTTRPIRPLIVDNGHFFNVTKPGELFVEVALSRTDAQAKYSKHTAWIRGNGRMRWAPRRWRRTFRVSERWAPVTCAARRAAGSRTTSRCVTVFISGSWSRRCCGRSVVRVRIRVNWWCRWFTVHGGGQV